MLLFFEKNRFLFLSVIILLICYIILNITLFEKIIPLISNAEFAHLGLLEGDVNIFHKQAIIISDKFHEGNYKEFFNDYFYFSEIPLNIKLVSILYFLNLQDPISVIYINSIYFLISIICIYKLSLIFFDKISYSRIFFIVLSLNFLLFPSIVYIFNSSGKEAAVIAFMLFYVYTIIGIFHNKKSNIFIRYLFLSFFFLFIYLLKPHFAIMTLIHYVITIIYLTWNLDNNKVRLIKFFIFSIILSLLFYLLSFVTSNFVDTFYGMIVSGLDDQKSKNIIKSIEFLPYFPDFIEQMYNKIYLLRTHFISHSLLSNPSTIYIDLNNIYIFLKYLPNLIINSILSPFPFTIKTISYDLFVGLTDLEMIITYLIYLSFLINIKNLKSYELNLILFIIICCTILFYINPNIGTHYRSRQPFTIILIILAYKNWMYILINVYEKFIKNNLNKFTSKFIYSFLKISSLNSFLILILALLIFFREFFFIKYIGLSNDLSVYLLSISFLSILSSSLNNPLNDKLVTNKRNNNNSLSEKSINQVVYTALLIILLIILFIFNSSNLFKIFGIHFETDFYLILAFSLMLISIPINVIFTSHLYLKNKSTITYLLQLIVPLTSFLFIYIYNDILELFHIYLSISIGIFVNSVFLIIASKINNFDFNIFNDYSFHLIKINQLSNLMQLFLSFFLVNSFILISIFYASNNIINEMPIINLGFRFTLLFNALIASIFTSMIMPLILPNNILLKNLFFKIIIFCSLLLLSLVTFIFISLENFIYFFLSLQTIDLLTIEIISTIAVILKIIPLSVIVGLLFKYFIIIRKEDFFLKITISYSLIYMLILSIKSDLNILIIVQTLSVVYFLYILTLLFFAKISRGLILIILISALSVASNFL